MWYMCDYLLTWTRVCFSLEFEQETFSFNSFAHSTIIVLILLVAHTIKQTDEQIDVQTNFQFLLKVFQLLRSQTIPH